MTKYRKTRSLKSEVWAKTIARSTRPYSQELMQHKKPMKDNGEDVVSNLIRVPRELPNETLEDLVDVPY